MNKFHYLKILFTISIACIISLSTFQNSILAEENEPNDIVFDVIVHDSYEDLVEYRESKNSTITNTDTQSLLAPPYSTYEFGKTTFSNFVWVANQRLFYNLGSLDIEKLDKNVVAVEVYDSSGVYYGKAVTPARANWISIPFDETDLLPSGKSYKIKFVNEGSGTATLIQGVVYYNY
ncbi:helicase associated domain-containing protein [Schinkia azotoformans]|uniref:helicase associated domain-containing protein n=1 Tax=Schinkia azotoformans TaxID=1454 RepID=UPI002DBA0890|nr:helicase associated domain-containing protein [Schinkia azotoformans]MEC1718498.1 helicase associated domain-containing protein [Schinkia azotoformans]MEC1742123.1 helicase associated domain-containing protein [Schinkia azotoformans]MEC1747419.1 helicase associated domain-containing protein [Schinkia azotoformans]MEC1760503.1 helicase associated domain-containing protein [Schinkia azotoformans]MEC1768542.1 helicase associated domain-containing protein [Schinkia azotoformans]